MGVMLVGVDLCWIEEMLVEDEDGSADLGSLAVAGSGVAGRDVVWCGQASVGSIMAVEIWPWLLGDEDGSDGWKFNGKWAAAGCCGRRLVGDGAGANGTPADGFGRGGDRALVMDGQQSSVVMGSWPFAAAGVGRCATHGFRLQGVNDDGLLGSFI
ncbi:hypothetical protein ACLOJK_038520 [Asimina triloba]